MHGEFWPWVEQSFFEFHSFHSFLLDIIPCLVLFNLYWYYQCLRDLYVWNVVFVMVMVNQEVFSLKIWLCHHQVPSHTFVTANYVLFPSLRGQEQGFIWNKVNLTVCSPPLPSHLWLFSPVICSWMVLPSIPDKM